MPQHIPHVEVNTSLFRVLQYDLHYMQKIGVNLKQVASVDMHFKSQQLIITGSCNATYRQRTATFHHAAITVHSTKLHGRITKPSNHLHQTINIAHR